jgi:hypothetical protein
MRGFEASKAAKKYLGHYFQRMLNRSRKSSCFVVL